MPVRLRPHHLLCILTYVGEGYSAAFVHNFDRIVEQIHAGEVADVVTGPDDVCAPVLDDPACHCHNASVRTRDRLAASDLDALLGISVASRSPCLDAGLVGRLRTAFAADEIRAACRNCPWDALCTTVAQNGFAGVRLHPISPDAGQRCG